MANSKSVQPKQFKHSNPATRNSRRSGLTELSIRNLGVIENANVELNPGLTVLSGETGAGKTMVLTALGLILGRKTDSLRLAFVSLSAPITFVVVRLVNTW